MKAWMKALLSIALSLMCLFTCVGYAAISDELDILGEVNIVPPEAIFILEIGNVVTNNATVNISPYNPDHPSTKFISNITFGGRNASVTFDVLVKNGTKFDQYFDQVEDFEELEGIEGSFSFANIQATATPGQGTLVPAGGTQKFTVTIKFTGSNSISNKTRYMLHELNFVIDSKDLTEAVSKGVTDRFKDILNNHLESDVTYQYGNSNPITVSKENTYDAVVDNMEIDRNSGNYIGNLNGADADDKALLTALFDGALTFKVGNEEVPITVMIKNKNVYDDSANEMVLYITADDLQTTEEVPVYLAVYSYNEETYEWEQVGDILEGEATVNSYSGLPFGWGGRGSFNTESWVSTKAYYNVAMGSKIDAVMNGYEKLNP